MKLKKTMILILTFIMILTMAIPASAASKKSGAVRKGKYWSYYKNGKKVKNKFKTVSYKGKKIRIYIGKNGKSVTGSKKIGKYYYYFNKKTGAMAKNQIVKIKGKKYFYNKKGHRATGLKTIKGKKYLFSPKDGKMLTGWVKYNGKTYYFDKKTGTAVKGSKKIGGKKYTFSGNGVLTKGSLDSSKVTTVKSGSSKKETQKESEANCPHNKGFDVFSDGTADCHLCGKEFTKEEFAKLPESLRNYQEPVQHEHKWIYNPASDEQVYKGIIGVCYCGFKFHTMEEHNAHKQKGYEEFNKAYAETFTKPNFWLMDDGWYCFYKQVNGKYVTKDGHQFNTKDEAIEYEYALERKWLNMYYYETENPTKAMGEYHTPNNHNGYISTVDYETVHHEPFYQCFYCGAKKPA